jgi:hypothetical protein
MKSFRNLYLSFFEGFLNAAFNEFDTLIAKKCCQSKNSCEVKNQWLVRKSELNTYSSKSSAKSAPADM